MDTRPRIRKADSRFEQSRYEVGAETALLRYSIWIRSRRRDVFYFMLVFRFLSTHPRGLFFEKKKTAASKLIVPTMVFCVAFVLCVFIASITLQMGIASWCDSVAVLLERCSAVRNFAIKWAGKSTYIDFYSVLIAGQVLAWFASLIWLANLVTLVKRMYHHVDFPDYFFGPFSGNHNAIQSETESE